MTREGSGRGERRRGGQVLNARVRPAKQAPNPIESTRFLAARVTRDGARRQLSGGQTAVPAHQVCRGRGPRERRDGERRKAVRKRRAAEVVFSSSSSEGRRREGGAGRGDGGWADSKERAGEVDLGETGDLLSEGLVGEIGSDFCLTCLKKRRWALAFSKKSMSVAWNGICKRDEGDSALVFSAREASAGPSLTIDSGTICPWSSSEWWTRTA
jgi:hypothetical protein